MKYTLRWCTMRRAALTAVLLALALAGGVSAADGIMLQIKDAPLKDVVALLTQQSGTNIVMVDDGKLERTVTASLTDVPLEKALDYIVRYAGVSYRKMEDGTYIIGGSFNDQVPVLTPEDVTSVLPAIEPAVTPSKKIYIDVIPLVHSKPSDLLAALRLPGNGAVAGAERTYPGQSSTRANPKITDPGGGLYNLTGSGSFYGTTGEAVRVQTGQPVPPTIDPRAVSPGAGRTPDPYTGAFQVPRPPRPGYQPNVVPGPPTPTPTPGPGGSGQGFLWPDTIEQALPFDLDNAIIVKGDEEGIEEFKQIVRMLDVPPKQVQIKAEFVEVSTHDVKRFGIDWSLQTLNAVFQTDFGPTGNVIVGFSSGNLTAVLRAQLTRDIGRVINSPIISTINNQYAEISINQVIPYWVTMNVISGDQVIEQSTPQFIQINTMLGVQPRVNGDGTITVQLQPQVSDTGAIVTGPDGTEIPTQRQQTLFTERRVANGETIVVGGFIRKSDSNSVQKIPILGDLPIVGSLFRTTAKTSDDRELLIFVTPTIIEDIGGLLM